MIVAVGVTSLPTFIRLMRASVLSTRGLVNADEKIPVKHPEKDLNVDIRHVVKSTLGFGGTNAALVFSHPEAK